MIRENTRKRRQAAEARLPLVAELYKRGLSIRKIQEEVNTRLDMHLSTRTIFTDIQKLLKEWRELRIESMDDCVTLELERIDECLAELWDQWEKSKENYQKVTNSRVGVPNVDADMEQPEGEGKIITVKRQQQDTNVVACGNPAYMAEIRQQLDRRCKILGLYDNSRRLDITSGGKPIDTKFEIEIVRNRE
jgi:hypothetical protein